MREVTFCEHSTITEAWVGVLGEAVPVVPEEPAAIVHAAKRELPTLTREPAMVVAEIPRDGPVSPFWSQQWSWDHGRLRARIGHRYLSVHRFADEVDRYETFERSLAPALTPWLNACSHVYETPASGGLQILQKVEQISYGYVNTFRADAADFDLSRIFHLTFGVDLEGVDDGLDVLDVKFHYRDQQQPATQVMIQIVVRADANPRDSLLVQTKTTATTAVHGFWKERDRIDAEILAAKSVAKRAFFEIATEATHRQMGAQYGN